MLAQPADAGAMEANWQQQLERNLRRRVLTEVQLPPPPQRPKELYGYLCSILFKDVELWKTTRKDRSTANAGANC